MRYLTTKQRARLHAVKVHVCQMAHDRSLHLWDASLTKRAWAVWLLRGPATLCGATERFYVADQALPTLGVCDDCVREAQLRELVFVQARLEP